MTIRASDREASERFYETVLSPLGIDKTYSDEHFIEWDDFSLSAATQDKPVTRRLHIGFTAPSRGQVDEFWRVGTDAGYRDDGAPGLRPQYSDDYYGAFLRDPNGNSVEAVHHADAEAPVAEPYAVRWRRGLVLGRRRHPDGARSHRLPGRPELHSGRVPSRPH